MKTTRHRIGSQQLKTVRAGTVAVVRPDGARQTVQVTLGQYPGWVLFGSPFPTRRTA